jgi:glutamate dehydrogenase
MTDTRPGIDLPAGADADAFARRYLAHAASQLRGHDEATLERIAKENREFGATRRAGETLVRIRDVDAETTVVEIVTDDAAFLVDSVRAE